MNNFGKVNEAKCKTRAEQVVFYMKRFLIFSIESAYSFGIEMGFEQDKLYTIIDNIPAAFLIGQALEIDSKFGNELDKRDLTTVGKVVSQYSNAIGPSELAAHITKFTEMLEHDEAIKDKFFRYIKLLKTLMK